MREKTSRYPFMAMECRNASAVRGRLLSRHRAGSREGQAGFDLQRFGRHARTQPEDRKNHPASPGKAGIVDAFRTRPTRSRSTMRLGLLQDSTGIRLAARGELRGWNSRNDRVVPGQGRAARTCAIGSILELLRAALYESGRDIQQVSSEQTNVDLPKPRGTRTRPTSTDCA
jgi:hypothetical protein